MLCVLKTGATWRDIPDSLPNWNAACRHFRSWQKRAALERVRSIMPPAG
ncbi:MAG: transposase [Clostridiales bacterium]|nr:transposase [Clostridiales bacterium]